MKGWGAMRTLMRIMLQFGLVLAGCAIFVAGYGDPQGWLILFYVLPLIIPGTLGSLLLFAPLERWLDRRERGWLIFAAAPAAGALVSPLFLQLIGNSWSQILAALPVMAAAGAGWGLTWALTRPATRLLFGPETG